MQIVEGPYVSERPYVWATMKPRVERSARRVGGGAAPATMTWTGRGRGRYVSLGGAFRRLLSTTGAAQKCVTP